MLAADTARVFIGLGSNLGNSFDLLDQAFSGLAALSKTRLVAQSPIYRSRPMGPRDQPDYLNAVAMLDTRLTPDPLLAALQALEAEHGRVRQGERWGPRTLDLDILIYGDLQINTVHLQIPHPGLPLRNFVLYPLADLQPDLIVPGYGPLPALLAACPRDGLEIFSN